MPPPTRLSDESAVRLTAVVDDADTAVDEGETPDTAMAKAARANALPVGHVALAVRAFNTGRAVRQLESSNDPWEKAAAYPQASVDGVLAALGVMAGKQASAPHTTDYDAPPGGYATVKYAFAPKLPEPKPAHQPAPPRLTAYASLAKAAAAYDQLATLCEWATPGTYTAVKAAALAEFPDAAGYAFGRLESENPWVREKAAVAPDPTTKTASHPITAAVAAIHAAKAAAVLPSTTEPADHTKVANAPGWYSPKPKCPHLGLVIPEKVAAAPEPVSAGEPELVTFDPVKAASFSSGFGGAVRGTVGAFGKDRAFGKAMDFSTSGLVTTPEDRAAGLKSLSNKVQEQTNADLGQVDFQAKIQEVLADPRFAKQDPKTVVDTFRQLHQLAPTAMRNPAVAGDFIQRRLQTGPLSYYDLQALTNIEKNVVSSSRPTQHGDEHE